MSVRGIILVALLISGCQAASKKRATPPRDFLRSRQGLIHGETEPFTMPFTIDGQDEGPACGPQACGNGRRDSCTLAHDNFTEYWTAETCDGDSAHETCEMLGYAGGELRCSETCQWDTSHCDVCSSGRCTTHRISRTGKGKLIGMAAASNGSRVRLVWGAHVINDGRQTQCLYSAWAEDDANPRGLGCNLADFPLQDYSLEPGPDSTFALTVRYDLQALRGTIDATGALVDVRVEEVEPPTNRRPDSPIEVGPLTLRFMTKRVDAPSEPPLWGRWYRDQQPLGGPFRIAHDPLLASRPVGAVIDDAIVLTWKSLDRGLVTTRVSVPESLERAEHRVP